VLNIFCSSVSNKLLASQQVWDWLLTPVDVTYLIAELLVEAMSFALRRHNNSCWPLFGFICWSGVSAWKRIAISSPANHSAIDYFKSASHTIRHSFIQEAMQPDKELRFFFAFLFSYFILILVWGQLVAQTTRRSIKEAVSRYTEIQYLFSWRGITIQLKVN
jgi:hypothetical protein